LPPEQPRERGEPLMCTDCSPARPLKTLLALTTAAAAATLLLTLHGLAAASTAAALLFIYALATRYKSLSMLAIATLLEVPWILKDLGGSNYTTPAIAVFVAAVAGLAVTIKIAAERLLMKASQRLELTRTLSSVFTRKAFCRSYREASTAAALAASVTWLSGTPAVEAAATAILSYLVIAMLAESVNSSLPALPAAVLASAHPVILLPLLYALSAHSTTKALELSLARREGKPFGTIEAIMEEDPPLPLQWTRKTRWGFGRPLVECPYVLRLSPKRSPHVLITGATGSGKTTTAALIVSRMIVPALIVDPHGEYADKLRRERKRVIRARETALNPLAPLPGETPEQRAAAFTSLLVALYKIGPLQQQLLYETLLDAYSSLRVPTLADVERLLAKAASVEPRAAQLLQYLRMLRTRVLEGKAVALELFLPREDEAVIVDLSGMTREQQILYTDTLLRHIDMWLRSLGETDKLRLLLIIDEAHLFAKEGSIVEKMLMELRKYGLAVLLSTQQASALPSPVLSNIGTLIALRQGEPKENNYISRFLSGVDESDRLRVLQYTLSSLPKGYAVIKEGADPILVSIEYEAPVQ